MPSSKKSVTVTYRKQGTRPPVFLAGSYSDPAWIPQEMEHADWEGLEGEYVFSKHILAEPGSQVQYKIRIGTGDWWVLNEDASTVPDVAGNWNNVIEVPPHHESTLSEQPDAASESEGRAVDDDGHDHNDDDREMHRLANTPNAARELMTRADPHSGPGTPLFAKTAAEVADSAALLDQEEPGPEIPDEEAGRLGLRRLSSTPIHEVSMTAAEVADSAGLLDVEEVSVQTHSPQRDHGTLDEPKAREPKDFNDPTLERFPTNRADIIDMMRTLGTGASQKVGEAQESDSGDFNDPTLEAFPTNRADIMDMMRTLGTGARRLRPRALSDRSSAVSLHSISEADDEGRMAPLSLTASDEDEGIALKDHGKEGAYLATSHELEEPMSDASGKDHTPTISVQASSTCGANTDQQGSPRIVVQPPDDADGEPSQGETIFEAGAASTALETTAGSTSQPRKRGLNGAATQVSSATAELQPVQDNDSWLTTFFRALFVRWFGPWIGRFCDTRPKTLLAAGTATVLVAYAGWRVFGTLDLARKSW